MPESALPTDENVTAYKAADAPLPTTYRRWHLYGAGLENVGRDGAPETVTTAQPGPDEILVRHDAVGICYSDIKIINLGENHPRLVGRDLAQHPVVMGHEVALTVVQVGDSLRDEFQVGARYIVQADVYYQGRNLAYGYAITGGMSEYGLIGPEVLHGDEGCYLLPLKDETGYAEAALVEPWACVEAAYHWTINDEYDVLPAGARSLYFPDDADAAIWNADSRTAFSEGESSDERVYAQITFEFAPSPALLERACLRLAKRGTVRLLAKQPMSGPAAVDVGRVHYDGHGYVGPEPNDRSEIKGGGICWMIGAAGPMGQMHVQRALSLPHPPARLLCTDRQPVRLASLRERFADLAREKGVELVILNIREMQPDFATFAPDGFDDIIVMVPSVEAIEDAFPRLAVGGVLNVFGGVARGVTANLLISDVATKNVRIVGTSGSSIADMRRVRDVMEAGQLDTGASVAAVGGLEAFRDGLDAVRSSRFPGKTVIFPHLHDLPLTALPELETTRPAVFAKLKDGKYWTDAAEAELLKDAR